MQMRQRDNCVDGILMKQLLHTISNDRSKHFLKMFPKFSCSFNHETFFSNLIGILAVFLLSQSKPLGHQNSCRSFRVTVIIVLILRLSVLGVSILRILLLRVLVFRVLVSVLEYACQKTLN